MATQRELKWNFQVITQNPVYRFLHKVVCLKLLSKEQFVQWLKLLMVLVEPRNVVLEMRLDSQKDRITVMLGEVVLFARETQ